MKRFLVSLILIFLFLIGSVVFDRWFMCRFAKEINDGLDHVVEAQDQSERETAINALNQCYIDHHKIANHFIFADRIEEIEMLLYKLNAYIEAEEENEILATAQELRSRINLLHSIEFYRGNHPSDFSIN